jgi:hypothetical protein
MRRLSSLLLAATLAVLAVASNAFAGPRFGISGFTGFQSYQMGQINSAIHSIEEALSTTGDRAEIDNLTGNWSYGFGVRADLTPSWRAYVEYERLGDKTGFGNNLGAFHFEPAANVIIIGGSYFFPTTNKNRFGFGAGVGLYTFEGTSKATLSWYTSTVSGDVDLGGSTTGFHARGEYELTLSDMWSFDAALGYRWAQGNMQVNGQDSGTDLDWSGLMTRAGFTVAVGGAR